ncbi:hypothetical protein [Paenibacillus hexagrammi]|uniref:Uncharacterized protein n=1 Tax=Paenibacillus hexagrammi TaxID=2908839 RepID=A0ABY3SHB7_9BACL|nr:hypothetical protein [Paenibacillus sp. YPD9-1]UJF32500.1 hypothetical protein L0M14_22925 [Paenibacillus sp. YPD9-1]
MWHVTGRTQLRKLFMGTGSIDEQKRQQGFTVTGVLAAVFTRWRRALIE